MKAMSPSFTPSGVPTAFYNLFADAGLSLDPPLDPITQKPITLEKLSATFSSTLMEQEFSKQAYLPIPEPVLEAYAAYRPTPLRRAVQFERALGTSCAIYYKDEGVSPVGSHKLNTALAQAYFSSRDGAKRLATETGAGQWGTALAFAARRYGLPCAIYMIRSSYEQRPSRRTMMELFGAKITSSPSVQTEAGRKTLSQNPRHSGSLGVAISEAIEDAVAHPGTKYVFGSVFNHVLLHQTVMGQEALRQMHQLDVFPDVVIACHGGGSNFGGLAFPFVRERLDGRKIRIIAAEPTLCPSLTQGEYRYDYLDNAQLTPLTKMYTLSVDFVPDPIHAGGLRYHGSSPQVSRLLADGHIEARAFPQVETFAAARKFAQSEGLVPAPESAHAIAAAIQIAREADIDGEPVKILFGLSGHGIFDLAAFDAFLRGKLD